MSDTAMTVWDMTDPDNPQPNIWPECPECHTPWAWRHGYTMAGTKWAWMRDCKHKKEQPVLMTKDGPYVFDADRAAGERE